MKHNYLTLFTALLLSYSAMAQNDTLLWENFEAETIDYIEIDFPTGAPNLYPTWLNFDVDGQGDGSGADRPGEWFLSFGFADQDSTNTVLASSSWLQGEVDGAENWLITPRIHIQDDQATLYWKSAPLQTPRYLDGYQVLVSTTDNIETSFTDTLAVFAEFDGDLTTDIEDTTTYVFSAGIRHELVELDSSDLTRKRGVLQQWEASLAAYEGQDIFIGFRHRSDDDNLISIDDILVLGTGSVGIAEQGASPSFQTYPNPVSKNGNVTIDFSLTEPTRVAISVFGLDGKLLLQDDGPLQSVGEHRRNFSVQGLASGMYFIRLVMNGHAHTERLIIAD